MSTTSTTTSRRHRPRPARYCQIDGCHDPHSAKGLCKSHYMKEYYESNKARILIRQKQRYEDNRDQRLAWQKEYTEKESRARTSVPKGIPPVGSWPRGSEMSATAATWRSQAAASLIATGVI